MTQEQNSNVSRRDFVKTSAVAGGAAVAGFSAISRSAFAQGSDTIKVGLVGCGGRGSGAARDCAESDPNVQLIALADLFGDKIESKGRALKGAIGDQYQVKDEYVFSGFDAYKKMMQVDEINYIILATPPYFRPTMLRAAIEAGKHVFMEKPVAVDPWGCRHVIESGELAKQKGLSVVCGTQRRHAPNYIETMDRILGGDIGEVVAGQVYWMQGGLWSVPRQEGMTDIEWQIRNWLYFTWLSGDHIVEQHIHNIDVMNWAMGGPPVLINGVGGRQARTAAIYGNVYDHFSVELTYKGDVRCQSTCRQIEGSDVKVGERIVGTKGIADPSGKIMGENKWRHRAKEPINPYVQEHADNIAAIRKGAPLNECQRIAESVLTGIAGRMAAYTGKVVPFQRALQSELKLGPVNGPDNLDFGDFKPNPVAIPGKTELV